MENVLFPGAADTPDPDVLKRLIAETPVVYILLDKEYRILYASDYFTKYRQFSNKIAEGNICYKMANGGKKCEYCAVEKTIESGQKTRIFRKDILPSGVTLFIDNYAIPIYKNDRKEFDYILEVVINRNEAVLKRQQHDRDYIEIIHVLSTLLAAKDQYTARHSQAVAQLSVLIAQGLGMSEKNLFEIEIAASLHDIGKVFIPNNILNKQGKLTKEEFEIIKNHPLKSGDFLEGISGFRQIRDYVQYHHEHYDGTGYPFGLKGKDIPIGARIISVADVYDAITSTRSYHKALDHKLALRIIGENAGTQFDPEVVDAFLHIFGEYSEAMEQSQGNKTDGFQNITRKLTEHDTCPLDKKEVTDLSQEKLAKIIYNHAPVSCLVMDEDYNILYANNCFRSILKTQVEPKGKKCYELSGEKRRCPRCPVTRTFKTGKMHQARIEKMLPEGIRYFDAYAFPVKGAEGKNYVAEILIDRTEETELQLQHEKDLNILIKKLTDVLAEMNEEKKREKSMVEVATGIARMIHIPEERIKELEIAASLANIGMISMGADGVVVSEEKMYMNHAETSWSILSKLSGFEHVKNIVLHHHEHYDGTGYPDGLKGREIPIESRIISIAEKICFDDEISFDKEGIKKLQVFGETYFDPGILTELEKVIP